MHGDAVGMVDAVGLGRDPMLEGSAVVILAIAVAVVMARLSGLAAFLFGEESEVCLSMQWGRGGVAAGAGVAPCWEASADMTMVVVGDAVAAGVAAAATIRAGFSVFGGGDARFSGTTVPPDTLFGCLGLQETVSCLLLYDDCTDLLAWVALPKQRQGCSS